MTHLAAVHVRGNPVPERSFYHPDSARMWAQVMADMYQRPLDVRVLTPSQQHALGRCQSPS